MAGILWTNLVRVVMFRSLLATVGKVHSGRWRWVLLVGLCVSMTGCTTCSLRGDRFARDEVLDTGKVMRRNDSHPEFFGFSNKARQIEEDLGAR